MYSEMGIEPSAKAVAMHYQDMLKVFVMDNVDAGYQDEIKKLNLIPCITNILMRTREDRITLAAYVLNLIQAL